VLFCDVTDSTPIAERRDPEILRRIMSRYFEETSAVLQSHGGTVEKYIGDAVMAVFGIPKVHEDDALRALRAATELRSRLAALNEELERNWSARIAIRIGVNTGEVVAGDPSAGQAFATGEAVNVAQRLESAAGAGEILIGDTTHGLARNAILVEPMEPLVLKGKSDPVRAWRLLDVVEGAPPFERRLDAPLVDREDELGRLREVFERTVRERACQVCTIVGTAGVGKSRLAGELVRELEDRATFLKGHCLAYGEGITFWPLMQIVREAGGQNGIAAALAEQADAALIIDRIRAMLGLSSAARGSEEIFWAVRRIFETLASERPIVVCLEDLHWAEPTFLDLIEYLAGWTRDAPVLLVCLARPELLDQQPSWLSGQPNASALRLEPLSEPDSRMLLEELATEAGLSAEARVRIADAAEGNPLYIEQMAAMAAEGHNGDGALPIPPTIQTLLAARLDRLEPAERAVIERAAVIGKEFWRGAVLEVSPEEERAQAGAILLRLVRKELVRPDRSLFFHEDAFRFRHVLIRDAAYAGIPKALRADLHERFARWIERNAVERLTEFEEIIGYHLEQAFRYRQELGQPDAVGRELAISAGEHLGAAGHRALVSRRDVSAAVNLITRAVALLPSEHPTRLELLPELGDALMKSGDFRRADDVLSEALAAAAAAGDQRLELRTVIEREFFRYLTDPEGSTEDMLRVAEAAIPLLEKLGDELGLAKAWWLLSEIDVVAGRWGKRAKALERALQHARRAGDSWEQASITALLAQTLYYGPTPVPEAITRCETYLSEAKGDRSLEGAITSTLGGLKAMQGEFDAARDLCARAHAIDEDLGLRHRRAARSLVPGAVEMLAGEPAAAELELRSAYETLEAMGEKGVRSIVAAFLGEALYALGEYDEARRFAEISEHTAASNDVVAQILWRGTRAKLVARKGELELAEQIAREAVELAKQTDFLDLRGNACLSLAEVFRLAGSDEERQALGQALQAFEQKGNVVAAATAEGLLARA
jgi:class 3 adenylate cyclase/tetratricopeptide (TPR) repeat protein